MSSGRHFYSRPCGRGDDLRDQCRARNADFYSRSCGRGDPDRDQRGSKPEDPISTHAPAGGATRALFGPPSHTYQFLLTPLREGRPERPTSRKSESSYFYSRPCGRGDDCRKLHKADDSIYFYSRPCGRGDPVIRVLVNAVIEISTHAPAGGATKSFLLIWSLPVVFLLTPLREGRLVLKINMVL